MDEVVKLLSIIFEKLWQSTEVLTDWRNGTPIFKQRKKEKPGKKEKPHRLVSLTFLIS